MPVPVPVDARVADALIRLPGVEGVALGGSRAQGAAGADSDWDLAVYYRGRFDPEGVRALGWPGELSDLGGWGPVFNGGGKLQVEGTLVDLHYRDLELIERIHEEAVLGRFTIEPLLFHQAGLPSYLLLAELGINRTLRGSVPRWEYPAALRETAPPIWWHHAGLTIQYAEEGHARHGRVAQCAGLMSEAACHTAHAILAHRGEWVTNEKRLLDAAGLRGIDAIVAEFDAEPGVLRAAVGRARNLLEATARSAGVPGA
jgi:predicted nucleotidyltransferase